MVQLQGSPRVTDSIQPTKKHLPETSVPDSKPCPVNTVSKEMGFVLLVLFSSGMSLVLAWMPFFSSVPPQPQLILQVQPNT